MLPSKANLVLGDADEVPLDLKQTAIDISMFSLSSSMSHVKDQIQIEKKKRKFVAKARVILDTIAKLNLESQNDLEALGLFVLQSLEDYIILKNKEKCQLIKEEIAIDLLKSFFKDDVVLTKQILQILQKRVKPTSFLRRNRKQFSKIIQFFLRK